jgi:hypothetical protein
MLFEQESAANQHGSAYGCTPPHTPEQRNISPVSSLASESSLTHRTDCAQAVNEAALGAPEVCPHVLAVQAHPVMRRLKDPHAGRLIRGILFQANLSSSSCPEPHATISEVCPLCKQALCWVPRASDDTCSRAVGSSRQVSIGGGGSRITTHLVLSSSRRNRQIQVQRPPCLPWPLA